MSTFLERMEIEHTQLDLRISSLQKFMRTPTFRDMSNYEQVMLRSQISAMVMYDEWLRTRVHHYTAELENGDGEEEHL